MADRAEPTAEQVTAILADHTDIRARSFKVAHHHLNTHVYVTGQRGEQVIVRVCDDTRWWDDSPSRHRKFKREQFGYRVMGQLRSVSVPEVLALDASERVIPYPFLLISHVPGCQMSGVFASVGRSEQLSLVRQLGALAAEIHSLPYDRSAVPPEAMQWGTLTESVIDDADSLREQRRISGRAHSRILAVLRHHEGRLAGLAQEEVFLHGDYAFRNVLVRQGPGGWQLCGLVDAELSGIGSRTREFWTIEPSDFRPLRIPGLRQSLLDGYGGRLSTEDYRLIYLMAELNPDHLSEPLIRQLDSDDFTPDLECLDVFA